MPNLPNNVKVVIDNSDSIIKSIAQLSKLQLLVGIPDINAGRTTGSTSNAVIGYIHEFGAPDKNIPARPFLVPTIKAMQPEITAQLRVMAQRALDGDLQAVVRLMEVLGLRTAANIKKRITDGIPPSLKASTVENRLRRTLAGRKVLKTLRGQDVGKWGATNLIPLIDTGALRNSITYVISKKK